MDLPDDRVVRFMAAPAFQPQGGFAVLRGIESSSPSAIDRGLRPGHRRRRWFLFKRGVSLDERHRGFWGARDLLQWRAAHLHRNASDTSRHHSSSTLKAMTRSGRPYCPLRKLPTIVSQSAAALSVST
jgi:hypothetical protein